MAEENPYARMTIDDLERVDWEKLFYDDFENFKLFEARLEKLAQEDTSAAFLYNDVLRSGEDFAT